MKFFKWWIRALLIVAIVVALGATWWLYQSSHEAMQPQRRTQPSQLAPNVTRRTSSKDSSSSKGTSKSHKQTTNKSKSKTPAKRKKVTVVALGDSLTQGVGDQAKDGGYVGQIKTKLTDKDQLNVTTHNYGKAGDRSDQILKRLNQSPAMQKQVANADAITMTVGGNDLMQGLQTATLSGKSTVTQMDAVVAATQQKYATKLLSLLTAVRNLNTNAPIFLFSIYNPVYVYFANVDQLNTYITGFNQVTKATANNISKLYFMNINERLSYGQYDTVAKRSALAAKDAKANNNNSFDGQNVEKALVGGSTGELNDYLSPADHFHPNHLGYSKMTATLYKTMQDHQSWMPK
ncbi:hypothetical protein LROSL1_1319 [Furfurilactobacillus rossiae]|uniref:SGNH/GDSL hydrolase family protein n=1 Tax=Furfurilactobacillus rossiae TaxID=231049 RepID=UPI0015BD31FB|nr:SGNH/GDSL hydrolase family protein [Furfurilactobacillus rossiae]MCF6166899.1 SGNH/GDSL hydrolase family protein [Furfurilactobacillus rossiae]QLE64136.1 hypothetical protein LROSL1_1319 [Furfurilactobacillus rossiae]